MYERAQIADTSSVFERAPASTGSRERRDVTDKVSGTFGTQTPVEAAIGTGKTSLGDPGTSGVTIGAGSGSAPYKLDMRQKQTAPRINTFFAVQEWEGHVIEKGDETFIARLVDITAGQTTETEEAELPLSDITHDERISVGPGSVFRWAIGYEILRNGQRRRTSQIVFRQLPKWTRREIESAMKAGETRAARIRTE